MKRALFFAFALSGCAADPHSGASSAPAAVIIQTVATFHRPESVAFSLDGRHLFVGNCGSDLFGADRKKVGFVKGAGAISKLSVRRDGRVRMINPRLVEGLDGPLGLAVLPKATDRYARGTLLVNVGISLLVDKEGNSVTDISKLGTGILFLDPVTGKRLGKIDLGAGSAVAKTIGHPFLLANSLAFDSRGNLFVTDTAKGGDRLKPAAAAHPGLLRIEHRAIDDPSRGGVTFTAVPGVPNGVGYWEAEKAVCVVTMGGKIPGGEAVYKIPEDAFPISTLPKPHVSGVGTMDGIAFTPAGTIVTSRFSGDLLAIPKNGKPHPVKLDPDTKLVAPADHRLLTLPDGTSIVAVPEQARVEPEPWVQRVRIIRLPKGF